MAPQLRCVIVGPGRSRNGLGPFLARFAERCGMRVVAALGRDAARTRQATEVLVRQLGHPIEVLIGIEALRDGPECDAVIIASPPDAHLPALRAALDRGLHVLCEKPLVPVDRDAMVDDLCDGFARAGLVLAENCQWPFVLSVFERLFPGSRRCIECFDLGLSPAFAGRAMLEDSLSHFLSVAQALAPLDRHTAFRIRLAPSDLATAQGCDLEVRFEGDFGRLEGHLELRRVTDQPRPAWISLDGHRIDRVIRMPDYALSWRAADGRLEPGDDPMGQLVYGFVDLIRERPLDRIRAESERVRTRSRLYRGILEACT